MSYRNAEENITLHQTASELFSSSYAITHPPSLRHFTPTFINPYFYCILEGALKKHCWDLCSVCWNRLLWWITREINVWDFWAEEISLWNCSIPCLLVLIDSICRKQYRETSNSSCVPSPRAEKIRPVCCQMLYFTQIVNYPSHLHASILINANVLSVYINNILVGYRWTCSSFAE